MDDEVINIDTDCLLEAKKYAKKSYKLFQRSDVTSLAKKIKKMDIINDSIYRDYLLSLDTKIQQMVDDSSKLVEKIKEIKDQAEGIDISISFGKSKNSVKTTNQNKKSKAKSEVTSMIDYDTTKSMLTEINNSIDELEKKLSDIEDQRKKGAGSGSAQLNQSDYDTSIKKQQDFQKQVDEINAKLYTLKYYRKMISDKCDIIEIEKCKQKSDFASKVKDVLTANDIKGLDVVNGSAISILDENSFDGSQTFKNWYEENDKYLSQDNKEVLTYLYKSKDYDSCIKYMNLLEDQLNKLKGMEEADVFIKTLESNPDDVEKNINNFLSTISEGTNDGLVTFTEGLANLFQNNENLSVNEYKQMFILQLLENNKEWKKYLPTTYKASTSFGNMLPSIVFSAAVTVSTAGVGTPELAANIGRIAGSLLMGGSVAGNSKHQALVQGSSIDEAWAYGIVNGLSEAGLEYAIGAIPGIGEESKSYILSIVKEGQEEAIQQILQGVEENIILGKPIDLNELIKESGEAALCGAIMGGVFNAGTGLKNGSKVLYDGAEITLNDKTRLEVIDKLKQKQYTEALDLIKNNNHGAIKSTLGLNTNGKMSESIFSSLKPGYIDMSSVSAVVCENKIINAINTMNSKYGNGFESIASYYMTGDASIITRTNNARSDITSMDRTMLKSYLEKAVSNPNLVETNTIKQLKQYLAAENSHINNNVNGNSSVNNTNAKVNEIKNAIYTYKSTGKVEYEIQSDDDAIIATLLSQNKAITQENMNLYRKIIQEGKILSITGNLGARNYITKKYYGYEIERNGSITKTMGAANYQQKLNFDVITVKSSSTGKTTKIYFEKASVTKDGKRGYQFENYNANDVINEYSRMAIECPELYNSINEINITNIYNPDDDYWRSIQSSFSNSAATGGRGTINFYKPTVANDLVHVLYHESAHNLDGSNYRISNSKSWSVAVSKDNNWSSKYASDSFFSRKVNRYAEDFADSVANLKKMGWQNYKALYPNRAKILKKAVPSLCK